MRFFFINFMCLLVCQSSFSQTSEIENKVGIVQLVSVQGNKLQTYDLLKQSKRKILVIEFWETWCMPCIEAMAHMNKLKRAYPNDLLVVCVASESLSKVINFIPKNQYPFDFVFDSTKQLEAIFPHQGIPHTIIIDKSGKIQSETLPNFFTEKDVEKLLAGNSIDLPAKRNDSQPQNNDEPPGNLIEFKLSKSNLGDVRKVAISNYQMPKKIIKNYFDGTFIDTVETIKEYTFKVKSILEIYQLAYANNSKYHFMFPKDLNYIAFSNLSNTYNLKFSSSNLFGNFDELFINQLNSVFGLQTEKKERDTTVLILKDIQTNTNNIFKKDGGKTEGENVFTLREDSLEIKGYLSARAIVNHIEDRLKQRVELNTLLENNFYEINLSMKSKGIITADEWIALLNKEGIIIEKERKKVMYISLSKK